MTAVLAGPARHARIILAPGRTLIEAVNGALTALAWPSATLLILGGALQTAVFHTSVLTPGAARWIDYGPPHELSDPAWLVMGSATYGTCLDGQPVIHCHAMLAGPDGAVGGHLAPDRCRIGRDGLVAHATSTASAGFRIQRDPVTAFDLLSPAPHST